MSSAISGPEWIVAGLLVSAPVLMFGLIEAFAYYRRRKSEAVARRSKAVNDGPRRRRRG